MTKTTTTKTTRCPRCKNTRSIQIFSGREGVIKCPRCIDKDGNLKPEFVTPEPSR